MALLEIRNLSVAFDTADGPFKAVDGFDLTIQKKETLAIVGESGSGKSVAMLAVMGLLPKVTHVTSDCIVFDGKDISQLSSKMRRHLLGKDMAMIFQDPISSLNPCFTVGFQIKEAIRKHLLLNRKACHTLATELLEQVGLTESQRRLKSFPHQLSGGMCQRVMIAMAIACRPSLLIADEPTTALDVTIQAQILDLLLSLQKDSGMALVLITHDLGVVAEIAERVCVQYAGQKVEEQKVQDLFSNPRHPYTSALLAALPKQSKKQRLPMIPGSIPGYFDRPSGCLFSPRCNFSQNICQTHKPPRQDCNHGCALCHTPLAKGIPQEMKTLL